MNKEKGFTLIELLIVVAIIGILAAIAIPQFNKYKERAARSTAVSDAKNLATEIEAYYADYGSYPDRDSLDVSDGSIVTIDSNTFTLSQKNSMGAYGTYPNAEGYSYTIHNKVYSKSVAFDSTKGGVDTSLWE